MIIYSMPIEITVINIEICHPDKYLINTKVLTIYMSSHLILLIDNNLNDGQLSSNHNQNAPRSIKLLLTRHKTLHNLRYVPSKLNRNTRNRQRQLSLGQLL